METSEADRARWYTWTFAMAPLKKSVDSPLYRSRPMTSGPLAWNGVVSVAVPFAAPLTYSVRAPLLALNTPTRWAHVPFVGAAVDSARTEAASTVSLVVRENAHRLLSRSYCRYAPEDWSASCPRTPIQALRLLGLTQAETVKLWVVSSTGPLVAISPVEPSNVAVPPDHEAPPDSVPFFCVPEASAAARPPLSFSLHQPAGWVLASLLTVCAVLRPIGA